MSARVVRGDADRVAAALGALLGSEVAVTTLDHLSELGKGKPRRFSVAARS